jgi:CHAD domain
VKARRVKKLDPVGRLDENAARIVRARVEELRSFAPEALEPEASKAQHDMRIAAKRVRYVLEVTGFCFGKRADTARKRARDLQDLLGEIHDCDVMLPRVQKQIDGLRADDARAVLLRAGEADDLDPKLVSRAPNRTSYRGLELLSVHLRARRALLFERFREFWQAEVSKGTWAKLERVVEDHLRRVRDERKAAQRLEHVRPEPGDAEQAERDALEAAERARASREAAQL